MKTSRDTPQWLANKMASLCYNEGLETLKTIKVLEPSAGTGILIDQLKNHIGSIDTTCIELNKEKCEVLKSKGYNTIHGDFFRSTIQSKTYDTANGDSFLNFISTIHKKSPSRRYF